MKVLTKTGCWTVELETARALYAAGDYDDVLRVVEPIIARDGVDAITRFGACQLKACVQSQRGEWRDSLETLKLTAPLVDHLPPELRAKFFGQRALAHRNLNQLADSLIDYEAARFYAQEVGDDQSEANVRNNLAKIYADEGRVDDALMEVDAAIKTAIRTRDDISLGRYYDTKAQILIGAKRYAEALTSSKKAVALLSSHPSGAEARTTHGIAMVGAGSRFLKKPETLREFRARRDAAKLVQVTVDAKMVMLALKCSGGHVLKAAALLDISHSALIKLIEKHNLDRVPKRRRGKSPLKK